jgi:hypothetical protein
LYVFGGANAGDAFLRGTQWLKWAILNIGDPLYRPFPRGLASFSGPEHREHYLALVPQWLAGGAPSSGVMGLNTPAPKGGMVVQLTCDQPEIVVVPQTVTVAENASTVKFPITTRKVARETTVRISMAAGETRISNTLVLFPPRP